MNNPNLHPHTQEVINLLSNLINTPSFSREEDKTADILEAYLLAKNIQTERIENNVIAFNKHRNPDFPLLVLNSHHDTVQLTNGWTKDPFNPEIVGDKIYGLGSNDAGASLCSLLRVFEHFYPKKDLGFQLLFIASAEEEVFGNNGLSKVLHQLDESIDLAIVGEPTQMRMAVAEKGLMVLDCYAHGESGHVANGCKNNNAIYNAMKDIQWINQYKFEKSSQLLGEVQKTVTQIQAGYQHNIIPDQCHFVLDVRINESYSNQEVLKTLQNNCQSVLKPRSLKWQASKIGLQHPLVQTGISIGLPYYGSSTLSDQVHFDCPSLKIGCGSSERSHTADEYIKISEISDALHIYTGLIKSIINLKK